MSSVLTPNKKGSRVLPGLVYVSGEEPGISRLRRGRGFTYRLPSGECLRASADLKRIRALGIPPAYVDVWICPFADGHLQATGYDARQRKQYRYHPDWMEMRGRVKFESLVDFARTLPEIRRRVTLDLKKDKPERVRVLATVVRILDQTGLRIGNDIYARENRSHGLTTLRKRHAEVVHSRVHLEFLGKSGRLNVADFHHPTIAAIIYQCHELPGQRLFQYREENSPDGELHAVTSRDVNGYLHEIGGPAVSAKSFRTWMGTVACAEHLSSLAQSRDGETLSETALKQEIVAGVRHAAEVLQNRPATCRKYYIHPAIPEAHREGKLGLAFASPPKPRRLGPGLRPLSASERAVLSLLI